MARSRRIVGLSFRSLHSIRGPRVLLEQVVGHGAVVNNWTTDARWSPVINLVWCRIWNAWWQFRRGRGRRAVRALASCACASAFRSSSQDEPDAALSLQVNRAVRSCCLPRLPSGSKEGQSGPAPPRGCSPVLLTCLRMSSPFIKPTRAAF